MITATFLGVEDWFIEYVKDRSVWRLACMAIHEAGHAVAALESGLKLGNAPMEPDEVTHHCISVTVPRWFRPARKRDLRTRQYAEHRILTAFVAVYAERKFKGRFAPVEAGPDYADAWQFAQSVCASEEEANAFLAWLRIRAEEFVDIPLHWFQIQRMAMYLLTAHRAIDAVEIKQVVEAAAQRYAELNLPIPAPQGGNQLAIEGVFLSLDRQPHAAVGTQHKG